MKSPKRAQSPTKNYPTSTYLTGFNPAKYGSVAAYKESDEHQEYVIKKEQILKQLNLNQAEKQQKLNKIKMQIDEIQRDKKLLVNLNIELVTLEKVIQYEYNGQYTTTSSPGQFNQSPGHSTYKGHRVARGNNAGMDMLS